MSALVAVLLFTVPGAAQTPRRPLQPLQLAARALMEGRYDEVDQITDKLDAGDPAVAAVKGRAAIARGRYDQADETLRPAADRVPSSEAALELGLLRQMLGRPNASATLRKVAALADTATSPADLARGARALRALGRFQQANGAYREAAAAAPDDPVINTAWGELFLEKYNRKEAAKSFQDVLKADDKYVPALIGMAETISDDNPPAAIEFARQALKVNPSLVEARIFLAQADLDEGHHDEARSSLAKALAVNPSSLEAHAWLAALAYVEDKNQEFEAEAAKALAIAPNYADVYRIAGQLAAHNYRFDEAVALTRRALQLSPNDAHALSDLGMELMRTGDEAGARTALEASFKLDDFDVVTKNLLDLLDKLDTFVTIRDGDIILRMAQNEAPVLQDYALALSHQALTTLAARYEFTPKGPILIEIFPKHDDFAVRTAGLPGMIGALGACFGRVVTIDSPNAQPPGEFQWEATLWHELAHVITIQMSNQRIPRWLTEGISVYEEQRARPEWARPQDVQFAYVLEHGQDVKLKDLNAAFTDPQKISLAYFQASLLVDHIVTAYGDAGLRALVRAFALGLDTDAALKTALKTDFTQMQAGFDQSLDRRFGPLRRAIAGPDEQTLLAKPLPELKTYAAEHPPSYPAQMALGRLLMKSGDLDGAAQAFQRASALMPVAPAPHELLAEVARQKHDQAGEIAAFTSLVAVDFDNVEAARALAALLHDKGSDATPTFADVNQRIIAIDPFDGSAHQAVGRIAMDRNQPDIASREFRAVLALKPVDEAAAHTDLAESYFKAGKRAEAKKEVIAALNIAQTYERALDLLLKINGGAP